MLNAEYEIQNFGFSVEQMKLERRYVIKQHLSSLLKHLVNSLIKKSNLSQDTSIKLINIQKDLTEKMFASFEKSLQSIEKLDEQNFSIPANVLLHQDLNHAKGYTKDDEDKLQNKVEELKKQFLENSVMISAIEAENNKYLEIQSIIQEELKVFQTVQETFTAINIQNMRQMVENVNQTLNKSNSKN
ncbi:uncharacterized protein LOC129911858 [Episyrphus balteatus]|uniref:uncharacterized protein LOC129911858 n=1 Tax=Episyrphus balteatus TaxID=286459 RepID=UPI0024859E82|nr:uncharacterized protein LOC129911858 [Episyrphus balteatus]